MRQSNCSTIQVLPNRYFLGSPWRISERLRFVAWKLTWLVLCRWTPRPFFTWRAFILRLFGASITGRPKVAESAIIRAPWRLTLDDRACIGPQAEIYNLGYVSMGRQSTLAQYAYLCGGSHEFSLPDTPVVVGDVLLEAETFVGAKAIVLLGVKVGTGAVIGAGAVVAKQVPAWTVWAGNPARQVRLRTLSRGVGG
jgi:putative colanic acid biosynthesis acetyltransferase WcaF